MVATLKPRMPTMALPEVEMVLVTPTKPNITPLVP